MKKAPPKKVGTIWPVTARIKAIDHYMMPKPVWIDIACAVDTPNAIKEQLTKLTKKDGYKLSDLWVFSLGEKRHATDWLLEN